MTVELAPPGFAGSNVTSRPPFPTATQRFAPGHVTEASTNPVVSICTGVVTEGVVGLNVSSFPVPDTAVHWVADGQSTDCNPALPRLTGIGSPGEVGLNVTAWPALSTAVH